MLGEPAHGREVLTLGSPCQAARFGTCVPGPRVQGSVAIVTRYFSSLSLLRWWFIIAARMPVPGAGDKGEEIGGFGKFRAIAMCFVVDFFLSFSPSLNLLQLEIS